MNKFVVICDENDCTEGQFETLAEARDFVNMRKEDAYEEYGYIIYQALEIHIGKIRNEVKKIKQEGQK